MSHKKLIAILYNAGIDIDTIYQITCVINTITDIKEGKYLGVKKKDIKSKIDNLYSEYCKIYINKYFHPVDENAIVDLDFNFMPSCDIKGIELEDDDIVSISEEVSGKLMITKHDIIICKLLKVKLPKKNYCILSNDNTNIITDNDLELIKSKLLTKVYNDENTKSGSYGTKQNYINDYFDEGYDSFCEPIENLYSVDI